ncbi:WbqC family protein [Psychroflexus montanilacus]|uniref:WbqC family protein n=1 Tax=Psychroflexus montanilacus TaxID=2873598 RepID=UPI001CCD9B34|nr:WbqC family protein [Psychroflexus montanilacus]MBZ9652104.1 WbqC family protein [Psychroflexus montanilacus]
MANKNTSMAVMQPYIFPYLGYFKLISCVDRFIFYDNVQYINRGFVHRNKILINGEPNYFNFQIEKSDQFKPINQVKLKNFTKAKAKLLNQLYFSYKKAPFFEETYSFIEDLLKPEFEYISNLNCFTLEELSKALNLETTFIRSSELNFENFEALGKEDKLDTLIENQKAGSIVMPPGSKKLYKDWIPNGGCEKETLEIPSFTYKQFSDGFVNYLSIIDVLMFNGFENTSKALR